MISPVFTTIVLCSCFIWLFMKMTTRNMNNSNEAFLERERQANSVRKQPLTSLEYITVNPDDFPNNHPGNERITELVDRLQTLSTQKIVNLTGISNTDLKFAYGVANLNTLMEYDQNFTALCRIIYDLGSELLNEQDVSSAISVLEKGVDFGTDVSANYTLLATLYIQNGRKDDIRLLIDKADSIKSLTKRSTIKKLQALLDADSNILVKDEDGQVAAISSGDGDNILPRDILDILETVPYKSDDQRP